MKMNNIMLIVFLCAHVVFGKESEMKEVIVVGGGIAGMAAARTLIQSGKFDVKVIEGKDDRYGGRIWTNRKAGKGLRGVDVELGSTFLNTKSRNNPLHKLVKEFELKTVSAGGVQLIFPEQTEEFRTISGENATKLYLEAFKVVIHAINRIRESGIDNPLLKAILEQYELDRETIGKTELERTMILDIIKSLPTPLCDNFSTVLYDVENEFGWDSIIVDGQDALIDRIVSGEGMESPIKIQLNKVARNIKVDEKRGKVLVRTTDRKQASVDAVVVAVPIGVLKAKSIIFEPALPLAWYKAIRDIGLGYSSKVIVRFDDVFWPKDIGSFLVSSSVATPGFLQMWTSTYRVSGNPILIGNIFGEQAKLWDEAPIEKLREKVKIILSEMFGADTVSSHKMKMFLRSDWSTDPLTLGSVSYPKVGNQPDLWQTLQKPVCPYIYFAGAYTESTNHVDSLHGAYNSGVRAAEQLLNDFCKRGQKEESVGKQKSKNVKDAKESASKLSKKQNKTVKNKDEL